MSSYRMFFAFCFCVICSLFPVSCLSDCVFYFLLCLIGTHLLWLWWSVSGSVRKKGSQRRALLSAEAKKKKRSDRICALHHNSECACLTYRCFPMRAGQDAVDLYLALVQRAQIHPEFLSPIICWTKILPFVVLLRVLLRGKSEGFQINIIIKFYTHQFLLLQWVVLFCTHVQLYTPTLLMNALLFCFFSNSAWFWLSLWWWIRANLTLLADGRMDLLRKVRRKCNFSIFRKN